MLWWQSRKQVALNPEGADLRHRKPGGGAEVCAERVEFSGLRLLEPPEQDALTPPMNNLDSTL